MEEVRKKGFFRKFLEWLNTPDEEEIVNGNINDNAFKEENPEVLKMLKEQSKKIDETGEKIFRDQIKKKAKNVEKAEVKTPKMNKNKEITIEDREQGE